MINLFYLTYVQKRRQLGVAKDNKKIHPLILGGVNSSISLDYIKASIYKIC